MKKFKKPKLLKKPDSPYEQPTAEELKRYSRLQRRWAFEELKTNGLTLVNSSDARVIYFLDEFYFQQEKRRFERKQEQIKILKQKKFRIKVRLLLMILYYPIAIIKKKWRKLFCQNKR